MSGWTLDRAPAWSGLQGSTTAVATEKGWEDPVTGEVLVAIRQLNYKAGSGDVVRAAWGVTPVAGGKAHVNLIFNEAVDVTEGAYIEVHSAMKAYGVLTASTTGEIANADTVTLGTGAAERTYTFATAITVTSDPDDILVGADAVTSLTTLAKAVNATGTEGTDYAASTTVHANVLALSVTTTKATASVTVPLNGAELADADTLAIGSTTYTWVSTTASIAAGEVYNGASATQSLANLAAALIATDLNPSTSIYNVAAAHPTVTATLSSVTTLTVTSLTGGPENNIVINVSDSTTAKLTGALLAGGTAAVKFEAKVGGSCSSACTEVISNAAVAFSTTQLVLGSTTWIKLYADAMSVTENITTVPFDKNSGGSTTVTWLGQSQSVSLTTSDVNGTIVDASTTTVSVTTITSSVANTLGTSQISVTAI
jgi:hypothetical protein